MSDAFSIELKSGKRVYARFDEAGDMEVIWNNEWMSLPDFINNFYKNL